MLHPIVSFLALSNRKELFYIQDITVVCRKKVVFYLYFLTFKTIKSIFHCDAKPLALGPHVGPDPQNKNDCVGHVDFMAFVSISFAWVANANMDFSGIWALVILYIRPLSTI